MRTLNVLALGLAIVGSAAPAAASKEINVDLKLPASASAQVEIPDGCSNKGNTITLNGVFASGQIDGKVWFTSKSGKFSTAPTFVDVTFQIASPYTQTFAKQGSLPYGVGGNPWILAGWIFPQKEQLYTLGRCVQGFQTDLVEDFTLPAHVKLNITAGDCLNHPGPYITIPNGTLSVGGVQLDLVLQNSLNNPQHQATGEAVFSAEINTPYDQNISVPKSPAKGGATGNPYVWLQIGDSSPINLGRCNKIGQ